VSLAEFAAWSKVNACEEGGAWHVRGAVFSGGLGISNSNWAEYGGTQFAANAADATPAEQIIVAQRIQPVPPDQHGCSGSW
jgi:resuscitation-promoting factor RpfA